MSLQVRETAAGKSISAYVILNRKGEEVATVQAHFSNGGRCLVNVWQRGAAAERSAAAFAKANPKAKAPTAESLRFQASGASGYGYDKFTAALRGMYIDGHKMTDHCALDGAPKMPKGRKTYPQDMTLPKGYSFANWRDGARRYYSEEGEGERFYPDMPETESGYSDVYRDSGLKYLEAIGYRVIQAI